MAQRSEVIWFNQPFGRVLVLGNDGETSWALVEINPKGNQFPGLNQPHFVEGTTETYIIIRGRGRIRVHNDDSFIDHDIAEGSVLLTQGREERQVINDDPLIVLAFLAICTPPFDPHNETTVNWPDQK